MCRYLFILFAGVGVISISRVMGQQLPAFTQYTFNNFLINPATAGSEGYTSLNVTSRQQWVGVEGAPSTNGISFQTRILKRNVIRRNADIKARFIFPFRNGKIGLGLNVYDDKTGILNTSSAQFVYAYHLVQSYSQLSMGVSFGFYQFGINKSAVKLDEVYDNLLLEKKLDVFYPDLNIGIYFTNNKLFCGLSVLNMLEASAKLKTYNSHYKVERNYDALFGYQSNCTANIIYELSVLFKITNLNSYQADITHKFILNKFIWGGFTYRTNQTIASFIGFKAKIIYLGYALDYTYNSLIISYSHEFMLALKFGDNVRRYRWVERY